MSSFIIEDQFKEYLKMVSLSPERLNKDQLTIMRDTFFGAYGMALTTLRDDMPDNEIEAVIVLESLYNQIEDYFTERTQPKK